MASAMTQAGEPPQGEPPQGEPQPDPRQASPDSAAPGTEWPRSAPWQARLLLRAARSATLATVQHGQPFASLVTPACLADGALLLLISALSEHTRHLMADPRCSVLVMGDAAGVNPQLTPRLTITGQAERVEDPTAKARYLAVHPYAALYADFTDFSIWRIVPAGGLLVAGFGRAQRLNQAALMPDREAVARIAAAEAAILTRSNNDRSKALAALAGQPGAWRMVTVDVDGFDLALEEQVVRVAWPAPVSSAEEVEAELTRLTGTTAG